MKARTRDFFVGLTALIGLVALATTLVLFGEFDRVTRDEYMVRVKLDGAGGLVRASPVRLNGVRVGRVAAAEPAPDPREGVVLTLGIEQDTRIPRDVQVFIDRDLVGTAALDLRAALAPGEEPVGEPEYLRPGDTLTAHAAGFLDQMASLLETRLVALDRAALTFDRLAETYIAVGERAQALLEPRTAAQVDSGEAPANIASTVDRLDRAARAADAWLGDEKLRADAKLAAERAGGVLDQAAGAIEAWTRAAESLTRNSERLGETMDEATQRLTSTLRGLDATVANVQAVSEELRSGEGTMGLLLTNPDLYNSLTDAARRLEKALLEAQLLIEKYRKEGIPVRL